MDVQRAIGGKNPRSVSPRVYRRKIRTAGTGDHRSAARYQHGAGGAAALSENTARALRSRPRRRRQANRIAAGRDAAFDIRRTGRALVPGHRRSRQAGRSVCSARDGDAAGQRCDAGGSSALSRSRRFPARSLQHRAVTQICGRRRSGDRAGVQFPPARDFKLAAQTGAREARPGGYRSRRAAQELSGRPGDPFRYPTFSARTAPARIGKARWIPKGHGGRCCRGNQRSQGEMVGVVEPASHFQ